MVFLPDLNYAILTRLSVVCLVLFFTACTSEQEPREEAPELPKQEVFDPEILQSELKDLLTDTRSWNALFNELRFGDTLSKFYKENKFRSLWIEDILAGTSELLSELRNARLEGLDPDFYEVDTIRTLLDSLPNRSIGSSYEMLAWMELHLSDNLLSFHRDRVIGRTEPDSIFKDSYRLPRRVYPAFDLMQVLDRADYKKILKYNTHREEVYAQYMELLRSYYEKVDSGETWFTIDTTGIRKIEPGDTTEIMPQVMHKLVVMGMASAEQAQEADSHVYNKRIAPYIETAQEQFGLFADGVIGRKTLDLINTTLEERITQIAATMERLRWFEVKDEFPYILVNLPAYELELHREDSLLNMRVCIGKARPPGYSEAYAKYLKTQKWWDKPRDFETPQVASAIHYLVINPTWTVPASIVTREMFHQMKKDPLYLRKNGYMVFYKGKELNPDTINWSKFKADKLPFKFVQEAGDENALGKVKFIFPNPFHVYLHDTPQRSKFKWTERAVSHGCVRVEQPIELGEFLMINHDKYDPDDFRILMGYEPRDEERLEHYDPKDTTAEIQPLQDTHILRLTKPVPVYFLYNTVWFDTEGMPQFRRDVYDKNKMIMEAMRNGRHPLIL